MTLFHVKHLRDLGVFEGVFHVKRPFELLNDGITKFDVIKT